MKRKESSKRVCDKELGKKEMEGNKEKMKKGHAKNSLEREEKGRK